MKAISIRQPWAQDILRGKKKYEYRSWSTDYRGELLICSSANPKIEGTIPGYALCIVEITDVIEVTRFNHRSLGLCAPPRYGEREYAWKLENLKMIKPFPVKGKLNFYYVDDELIEIIDNSTVSVPEKEADALFEKYIEPLLYHPKRK